jgi:hypothetical protein
MVRGSRTRVLTAITLLIAEAAVAMTLLALSPAPSDAQFFFEDRFPFQNRRQRGPFEWFEPAPQQQPQQQPERAPPSVDYSKAPAPKKLDPKAESAVTTPILVLGDSMADWLAYGLELAYADSPEIGILRRHRTNSGLIRTEVRSDPRGDYPDWPLTARELIAAQKPKFVLMMVGINDRRQFRETGQVVPAARTTKPPPQRVDDPAALELDKSSPEKPNETPAVAAPEPAAPVGNRTLEFRTDAWSEAYIRRIDDTIAALKTSGVPVFWVGLPPSRGQKSAADVPFLNDLYRSRADKAGIIYIDVWDGFVDEDGRYAQSGPDVEGQTRRLRSGDGVYFTQAGARKLAHYVEREVQRWLSTRTAPVAVAIPEEPKVEPAAKVEAGATAAAGSHARPLAGPVVTLIAGRGSETDNSLGGNNSQPANGCDGREGAGEGRASNAPAGRADDFAWLRRDVARLKRSCGCAPPIADDPDGGGNVVPQPRSQQRHKRKLAVRLHHPRDCCMAAALRRLLRRRSRRRPDYRRPSVFPQFNFQSLFGGRW